MEISLLVPCSVCVCVCGACVSISALIIKNQRIFSDLMRLPCFVCQGRELGAFGSVPGALEEHRSLSPVCLTWHVLSGGWLLDHPCWPTQNCLSQHRAVWVEHSALCTMVWVCTLSLLYCECYASLSWCVSSV